MPHLSWNEVRARAIRSSLEHVGDRSESAQKQTFWNDFFHVFGLRRASFEANVTNLKGNKGAIDLLWKGKLLVEHKSFGEDLAIQNRRCDGRPRPWGLPRHRHRCSAFRANAWRRCAAG